MRRAAPLLAALAAGADASGGACPPHAAELTRRLDRADRRRARLPSPPSAALGGRSPGEVREKINAALLRGGAPLRDCAAFSAAELNALIRTLLCRAAPELARVYADKADGRARRLASLADYERSWEEEGLLGAEHAEHLRDGKCMEAVMLYAHHLSAPARKEVAAHPSAALPSLPEYAERHAKVSRTYAAQATCITGHNMTSSITNDHVWPHWPAEVHYNGTGFGAYPFWQGGQGQGGSAPIEVWWSETKQAEKFYHESCYMNEAGYSGGNVPCYNLFIGTQPNPGAYLYTAKGDFCCQSGPGMSQGGLASGRVRFPPGGGSLKLSAPQGDFMDTMPYQGTVDFTGPYYKGKAKSYVIDDASGAVTYFWYYTDMNDKPVEQGEGGHTGRGIEIHHDYDTSTFKAASLDASVFAVPDVCKTTTKQCAFP